MKASLKTALAAAALLAGAHASAQVTFYEGEGFHGRAFNADRPIADLSQYGFNDRASSAVVERGRWEVCDDAGFRGHCVVIRRGSYDSLRGLGLDNRISSVRPFSPRPEVAEAPQPLPAPTYEFRRRPSERLFEAPVTSVHAVLGPPDQRCWVERQPVASAQSGPNVPGAIIGGVLGGILGHQIGGGSGKTVATIGGAVGGTALGANVGTGTQVQNVRRCDAAAPSGPPQFWDVSYNFRGVEHRVQMSSPPGRTIMVNSDGTPRE
jgi:uncharacterized protein YcfJ